MTAPLLVCQPRDCGCPRRGPREGSSTCPLWPFPPETGEQTPSGGGSAPPVFPRPGAGGRWAWDAGGHRPASESPPHTGLVSAPAAELPTSSGNRQCWRHNGNGLHPEQICGAGPERRRGRGLPQTCGPRGAPGLGSPGAEGRGAFWGAEGRDGEMGRQEAGAFQPTADPGQTACPLPCRISASAAWVLLGRYTLKPSTSRHTYQKLPGAHDSIHPPRPDHAQGQHPIRCLRDRPGAARGRHGSSPSRASGPAS